MKKLPTYELIINDDDCIDNTCTIVNKISLVSDPAIEIDFVAFSKEKVSPYKFKIESAEKRYLTGVFMVPDQPIYRANKDVMGNIIEEYYVIMSRETIEKAVKKFFKYGYTNQTNIMHDDNENAKDVYVIESWITTEKNDKIKNYGFNDIPEGSWAGTIFVENEDIWNDYIKTGQLKGFSIEGNFLKSNEPITESFGSKEDKDLMMLAEMIEEFLNQNNIKSK